jgi:hypothetical protein
MLLTWGLIVLLAFSGIYAVVDLLFVCFSKTKDRKRPFIWVAQITGIVVAPLLFLFFFDGPTNDCCGTTAFFSPNHRLTIHSIMILSVVSYVYSNIRSRLAPPLLELLINCFLIIGLILSVFVALHLQDEEYLWMLGIPAVFCFYLSRLIQNHRQLITELTEMDWKSMHPVNQACLALLNANVFLKFPLLLILTLPVLILLSLLLYVFGQRPDSVIRAFTETYRGRFSQWDYQCENVACGGHYLCSVAANGHTRVVKPVRIGKRHGHYIICNRQLLVSNAFEELIQEKCPVLHRLIRKQYDKVGDMIHRNYSIYSKKWVSDIVYIIMKPAEWAFVLVLYLADRKPEQRIARQYAPWK